MPSHGLIRAVFAFVVLSAAIPTAARAAYTWSTVTPEDGKSGSGSAQAVGAVFNWGSTDTAPNGGGISVAVIGGYGGELKIENQVINIGSLQATFQANVSFDPPLASGRKYIVTFGANFPSSLYQTTTTTVTVP